MRFLAPLFLTALVAVGVPIVLHLIQREKREATPFPSLMFLQRIPHRSTRRRRIRDLPLLLLRIAAVMLLAGAFARPLLERRSAAGVTGPGAREVVLLIDRSYSMSAGHRWDEARQAALREVDALRPGDRMSVVAFDVTAAALNPPTGDAARLRALVSALTPGSAATRFDPALRLAGDLLSASHLPRRELVVVSDLQRAGVGDGIDARLPGGTTIRAIVPRETPGPDLAVAGVNFRRTPFGGQERVTATARIVNPGAVAVANAPVALLLDGQTVQATRVSVGPHAAADVALPPFTVARAIQGEVRLGAHDDLAADDAWHFSLSSGQSIPVLALDDRPGRSMFLARGLSVGDAEPRFSVSVRTGDLSTEDLRGRSVVVLNGAVVRGAAARRLREFVENGGGLVVVAGAEAAAWDDADLLPAEPGAVRDRVATSGATLAAVDMTHPVFDVFRAPHSGDLSAPRFYRYRALAVRGGAGVAGETSVLARFDDGAPALVERRVGRGRVLVWASTFDREWTDLPVQPVFVPLIHRLIEHASSFQAQPPARRVGDVVDARLLAGAGTGVGVTVLGPDGRRQELEPGRGGVTLEQAGFYSIRPRAGAHDSTVTVAVNVDAAESDLAAWTPAQFAGMVRPGGPAAPPRTDLTLTAVERERRQSLWWWLLVAVAAVLALETWLSSRRAARTPGGASGAGGAIGAIGRSAA